MLMVLIVAAAGDLAISGVGDADPTDPAADEGYPCCCG